MILTIDAGNTNIAIGLFRDAELVCHWRLASKTQRTADEVLLHLRELFSFDSIDGSQVHTAVISSVVPALTHAVHDGIARLLQIEPIVVSSDQPLPITLAIETPSELGSDLLANAVAGHSLAGGAAIIVDFGTALSFTAVDSTGTVRGAAIAPGLGTAVDSLVTRTAALPMIDLGAPKRYIGTNTVESLRSGIVHGYAGLVDAIVAGMAGELSPGKPLVVATGGESALITRSCRNVDRVEPWLTLRGLAEIGRYATANQST